MHRFGRATLALTFLVLLGDVILVQARCTGNLKRTCVRRAFRCFNPRGACVQENVVPPGGLPTVIRCWANGAREVSVLASSSWSGLDYSFDYTTTLMNSRGTVCATGSSSYACHFACGGTGTYAHTLTRGERTWRWGGSTFPRRLDVTCPSGKQRSLALAFAPTCADVAACRPGTCPGSAPQTVR